MDATVHMLRKKASALNAAVGQGAVLLDTITAEELSRALNDAADTVVRTKAALTTARADAMEELSQHFETMATNCLPGQEWVAIVLLNNAAVARALAEVEKYGHPGDVGC